MSEPRIWCTAIQTKRTGRKPVPLVLQCGWNEKRSGLRAEQCVVGIGEDDEVSVVDKAVAVEIGGAAGDRGVGGADERVVGVGEEDEIAVVDEAVGVEVAQAAGEEALLVAFEIEVNARQRIGEIKGVGDDLGRGGVEVELDRAGADVEFFLVAAAEHVVVRADQERGIGR